MELEAVLRERFSVRKYQDIPVEEEKLNQILEAGILAPTGKNNQPQRIYVLKSPEALKRIRSITSCAFDAPVVLLIACDETAQWNNPLEEGIVSGQQDVSIVATYMMLEAWNLGIGSCWVNYFPNTEVAKAFGLPEHEKPMLLLTLGYASDTAKPALMHFESKSREELIRVL